MAIIIFPAQREDRYSAVKRLACVDLGLPTQCINSRTISQENKLRSVTQKIALQINCKLGGELWALKIPMTGLMVGGLVYVWLFCGAFMGDATPLRCVYLYMQIHMPMQRHTYTDVHTLFINVCLSFYMLFYYIYIYFLHICLTIPACI